MRNTIIFKKTAKIKKSYKFTSLLGAFIFNLLISCHTQAAIEIKLQEPNWRFLLNNNPFGETQTQVPAEEANFATKIQPLLEAGDHQAIVDAFSNRKIDNDSAALRLLRGQVLIALEKYSEAEIALRAAINLLPDLANAHQGLSLVYLIDKNYEKAREHLRRAIELGVADAQTYGQLGYVNLQLKNASSAIAGYQYATFLEPGNAYWRQGLLFSLTNAQAYDQAQALLEEMLEKNPVNAQLWLQRSQIAIKKKRYQQALASLESAISLGESSLANINTAIQLHIQNGSATRAIELLSSNMRKFSNAENIDTLDQIAEWFTFKEQWRDLETLLKAFNGVDRSAVPNFYRSRFYFYEAELAITRKRTSQAKKSLESALNLDPNNGEALLSLAEILKVQKREERAILLYARAQALTPYKERALLSRAQLEIDRQAYREALRLLREVAKDNPQRGDVLSNIRSLEKIVLNQN